MRHQGIFYNLSIELYGRLTRSRPCYVGLKNNVSTRLLETTLNQFPPGTEDFVTHKVLCDYIQATAVSTGVDEVTHYDTDVRSVTKTGKSWKVETATLQNDENGLLKRHVSFQVSMIVAVGTCRRC
jgi:hypothetical protein